MTDLEVYQTSHGTVAVPRDIDSWTQIAGQVIKLANEIYDTPFVPDGLRGSVPATAAAILAGRELGLEPLTSLANIHVIKGKPSLSAALMRALILAQGHQIETVDISDTRAVIRGRRRGESTWEEASFTADQARRAQIQLGGYPQDKLYARATSRLARRKFADVIAGMPYSAEELEDGEVAEEAPPPAVGNGHAPAAPPRTAQRRQRAAKPDPAPVSAAASASGSETTPQAAPARTARPARTDAGLPPLPGEEDEPGPTRPGSSSAGQDRPRQETSPPSASSQSSSEHGEPLATGGQVGIIQSHFKRLDFGDDEREQRLQATALIAGRPGTIASTKELTQDEAKAVADTLSRCRDRERLIVLLAQQQQEEGQGGDE